MELNKKEGEKHSLKNISLIFSGFFIIILLASNVCAIDEDLNFENRGKEVAQTFIDLLDSSVENTLYLTKLDFSNMEQVKNEIQNFYNSEQKEIWYNIGSDKSPIEQREIIPIYSEITFTDSFGNEVIKYNGEFSTDLEDVSIQENTKFKSETYFSEASNLEQGKVNIGKVMTWYTSKEEVFQETSSEEYEGVIGRDLMKQGIIRFSSPVYNNGEFFGVIILSLDYRHLQELSKHINPAKEDLEVSTSYAGNYLLIFDIDGNTIAHPKPDNIRGYLEDGQLAGYNEPNSTREGNIFNLYKYQKSRSYSEMAVKTLEEKDTYISSATDVGGRTKLTVTVPILYNNPKSNYADIGVFGGIMMSVELEEQTTSEEEPQNQTERYLFIFGLIIAILLLIIFFILLKVRKSGDKGNVKPGFKEVIFGKISRRFIFILGILILSIIVVGALIVYFQEQVLEDQFTSSIIEAQQDFQDIEDESTRTLSAALEVVLNDESMKQVYLEKDREKLYNYGQPVFNELKERYYITHFYFHLPNGTNFVRIHNKDKYNDMINRATFIEAKETGDIGTGIELGKTAYALRVVRPYYDEGELIGYVELGQEIDEFLKVLKKEKNNEFLLVVEKKYLDEDSWASVRETHNLRNNWGDLDNYLVISSTREEILPCFSDKNMMLFEKEVDYVGRSTKEDTIFACGGFPLVDAFDEKSGVVFSLIDVTAEQELMYNIRYFLLAILGMIILVFIGIGGYISKNISKPISELGAATKELQNKNFKARVNINTGDELQALGESFNKTAIVLDKMDEEHKQLDKAKTEFLSITSHELRSPMTPMKAQLQMLIQEYFGKITSKQRESLEIVLRNTERLDDIIQDFLEISRIEAARLKFKFVKTDLTPHIKRLVSEMEGFMPEKEIKLITKIDPLPTIEVDPDRAMQVLRNLINNAKKFSPPKKQIFIKVKKQGSFILFSVKDQGIGVNKEDQKRLFEPFFQAEQTMYREHGGTGLGLAIIRGIVESQNGKVWIESEPKKGATFYFTVPLKPVKEMKSIKLLFSGELDKEKKIKEAFKEFLGPIGEREFESLEKEKGITEKNSLDYINYLEKKVILSKEISEQFKNKILVIYDSKTKNLKVSKIDKTKDKIRIEDLRKKEV